MYQKQIQERQCDSTKGPNCFFINGDDYFQQNQLIDDIVTNIRLENRDNPVNLITIIKKIRELKMKYLNNNSATINQVFSITPQIQMNLLLNFESYDITTQYEDIYLPEEKIIKFNIGHLKLTFKGGKFRITQERIDGKPKNYNKQEAPYGAFAVIEDDGKNEY